MTERHGSVAVESGISESIGFMLIFTIILAGIGLVTLYGYPILMQQQTSADEKIMEKNMIVLQNDIKSLAYKTVPYKETSLKIGGGTLFVQGSGSNPGMFTIAYGTGPSYTFDPGELRYESVSAQTDISLTNGAVITRPRTVPGSAMLAEPRWIVDTDPISHRTTMVISLIKITSDEDYARAGIGTVRMKLVGDPKVTTATAPGVVTISYTPAGGHNYAGAWGNYFTSLGLGTGPSYQMTPDTLYIKEYEIKIEGV